MTRENLAQYRVHNPSSLEDAVNQFNRILAQIAMRFDELQGSRGTPTFYADVDLQSNKIGSVAAGSQSGEVLTYGTALSDLTGEGTTITVLHGNATGVPAFSSVVVADMY